MLLMPPASTDETAVLWQDQSISWAQLWQRVSLARFQLQVLHMAAGDPLLLIGPACLDQLCYLLAGWQLALMVVPLNPRLPAAELERRAQLVGAKVGFWPAGPDNPKWTALPRLELCHIASPDHSHWPAAEKLADLLFTSGSSGQPKIIAHSFANHWASASGSHSIMPLQPVHRYLLSLPLAHVGGIAILWRWLASGCQLVLPQPGAPLSQQVVANGITHLSLVGAQLDRLLEELDGSANLLTLILGGGPVPSSLIARGRTRGWRLLMSYGLTEMSATVTAGELGGCGKPLPGRELTISDDGEILVRGATLAAGIWEKGALLPLADNDGWYHTGDCGHLDPFGNLHVNGRRDSRFVSGGENIQPEHIEAALLRHPAIHKALVVPVPHPRWGMRPVAFIDNQQLPLSEVQQFLAPQLARFEWPDALLPWPQHDPGLKPNRQQWQETAIKSLANGLAKGAN